MIDDRPAFTLTSRSSGQGAPVLAGVQARGRLDGLLFELTLRQRYRHDGPGPVEVVYTFPLATAAVLTGFAAELNGERRVGAVVARTAAEQRYEKALSDGDAPVMLERLPDGLYTANIGNLKPGDELVVEIRHAELLAFEQGRIRLAIPTTIAPRYGKPAEAGLQPQQTPEASLAVEYPLALDVEVAGQLARGSVDCPTHPFRREDLDDGLRLTLDEGATLDRDVVLLVQPREPLPSLVMQADDAVPGAAPLVRLAAFQLPPVEAPGPIGVKLLVDCSGSMAGDGIASARAALRSLVAGLVEDDHVALSAFGDSVQHLLEPGPAGADRLRRLAAQVDALEANLGGTEMAEALKAVLAIPVPEGAPATDLLLITDGAVWDVQGVIDQARRRGQRVFVIGVGSAPATGGLRRLAEESGGACEFATPGESLHAAARRMANRLRQTRPRSLRIDWGVEPLWQTPLGLGLLGGDTAIAWAGLPATAGAPRARLLSKGARGQIMELARAEADAPCTGDTLPRLAAARRLGLLPPREAASLALAYRLISDHTHCILVQERADEDQVREAATLHRVASMLAANSAASADLERRRAAAERSPNVRHKLSMQVRFNGLFGGSGTRSHSLLIESNARHFTLNEVVALVHRGLERGTLPRDMVDGEVFAALHPALLEALTAAYDLGVEEMTFWVLLAWWLHLRAGTPAEAAIEAVLKPRLDCIEGALAQKMLQRLEQCLGQWSSDAWAPFPKGQLHEAMKQPVDPGPHHGSQCQPNVGGS